MKSIVYISKTSSEFSQGSFITLGNKAKKNNLEIGITGYLFLENDHFIQYIEGENQNCSELISAIEKDDRHQILRKIENNNIQERRFPEWSMECITEQNTLAHNLESILHDIIANTNKLGSNTAIWEDLIWSLISSLAELHKRQYS